MLKKLSQLMLIFSVIIVTGCTSEQEKMRKKVESRLIETERTINVLKTHLVNATIPNARILKQYAKYLKSKKPELAEVIDSLANEGTVDSLMFNNLQSRFVQVRQKIKIDSVYDVYNELGLIKSGANFNTYNMMLTDQINVIADMSDGQLGRVESLSKEASLTANRSTDYGAGSQLVGNPNYGSWRTNSSGTSVWTWFAMYAMFNSMNRSPIYYDRWSSRRDYSYYGSVGRNYYSSPAQRTEQKSLNKKHTDKFARQGKKFQSPYAKPKVASAKVAQQRQNIAKQSRGSASSRSASSRTSRSSSRGK